VSRQSYSTGGKLVLFRIIAGFVPDQFAGQKDAFGNGAQAGYKAASTSSVCQTISVTFPQARMSPVICFGRGFL